MIKCKDITLAESLWEGFKDGELKAIPLNNDRYVDVGGQKFKVGDKLDMLNAETGEILKSVCVSVLEDKDGQYMMHIDTVKSELIFVVKDIPKASVNQIYSKKHWGYIQGIKDRFKTLVWKEFKQTRIYYKCDIEYTFLFQKNVLDPTNCFGMIKIIEDIIVLDDSGAFIRSNTVKVGKTENNEKDMVIIKVIY